MRTVWAAEMMPSDGRSSSGVFAKRLVDDGLSPCLGSCASKCGLLVVSCFGGRSRADPLTLW
jgi:hypothetical protein